MNTLTAAGRFAAARCRAVVGTALVLGGCGLLSACGGGGGGGSSSAPAPVATIALTPASIAAGATAVLKWSVSNASSCTASGAWSGPVATSGSQNVTQSVPGAYSYSISCSGTGGTTSSAATLNVSAPLPVISLTLTPATISTNHSATLAWSATNSTNCEASGAWGGAQFPSGSITVAQASVGSYTYTLSCTNGQVSASQSATLTVVGPQTLTATLSANPTAIAVGQSTTLSWSSNGDSCQASGGWSGTLPASGSQSVVVANSGSNLYYLQCSSATGDGSAQVTVQGLVATVSLSANPLNVGPGQSTTLSWSSTQAQSCIASGEWSGTLPSSGSKVVTPGSSLGGHNYSLSCSNPGAAAQASVVVTTANAVATLTAFPTTVVSGKTVTLRWQGQNASSCLASGDWSGTLAASGFQTLTTSGTGSKNYSLVCSSPGGSSPTVSASVTVLAAEPFPPATAYRVDESHDGVVTTTDGSTVPTTTAPAWKADFTVPVSYPLIAGGIVFVTTDNPDQSYGNQLYALDAKTGAKLWGPVAVSGTYFGSGITYDNGKVFLLMFGGDVHAFNATNGAPLWTAQLPGYWYDAMPNAYGGTVFVLGNGGLSALDEATGNILWTNSSMVSTGWDSPAVSSEGVYEQEGDACKAGAYQPLNGTAIWENTTSACATPWGYTPVISGGTFFGRTTGSLNLFDAESGTAGSQLAAGYGPAITSTAVIALNSGTLSSTRRSDLVQTWTFTGDGNLLTAPLVVNNTVFVGSSSGNVYGLDLATGKQTWQGISPLAINQDSEDGGPMPPAGPAAGEGLLIYTAGFSLVAWQFH